MKAKLELGHGGHTAICHAGNGPQMRPKSVRVNHEGLQVSGTSNDRVGSYPKYWQLEYYFAMLRRTSSLMFNVFAVAPRISKEKVPPKIHPIYYSALKQMIVVGLLLTIASCNKIPQQEIRQSSSFTFPYGTMVLPNALAFVIDPRTVKKYLGNRVKASSVQCAIDLIAHSDINGGNVFVVPMIGYGETAQPLYFRVPGVPKSQTSKRSNIRNSYYENVIYEHDHNKFISDSLAAEKKLAEFIDSVKPTIVSFLYQYYYWEPRKEYNIDEAFNYCRILLNTTGSKGKIIIACTAFEGVHQETLTNLTDDYITFQTNYLDAKAVINCNRMYYFEPSTVSKVLE